MKEFTLKFNHHFDSAHQLPDYKGKCANAHGHRWEVRVSVKANRLDGQGMVVDFTKLKTIIDKLDHCWLNDLVGNPTAENLASYIFDSLKREGVNVDSVELWESPGASIEVRDASGE